MNSLEDLYIAEKLIGEEVKSPSYGLNRIVKVAPHYGQLCITLDNEAESKYLFPDSFLENYLEFTNVEYQKIIEEKKLERKKELNFEEIIENTNYKFSKKNVAYLYDYYKKDMECSEDERNLSSDILGYKDQNPKVYGRAIDLDKVYSKFTHDLFELASKIIHKHFSEKNQIILISVPRSDSKKSNAISKSIKQMVRWAEKREGYFYNNSIKLIDGSKILERKTPIEPEKQGDRSIEKHLNSIIVKHQFTKEDAIILLDDISTTGNTMDACKELLVQYGASEQNVVCAALAQTVLDVEKYNDLRSKAKEALS